MIETIFQEKYLINFLCDRPDGLKYTEVKANTVSSDFFIKEDIKNFISVTSLNKNNYRKLLKKFPSEKELISEFIAFLTQRINESVNMAIFINSNKTVTFKGVKLHLFYPSGTETSEDKNFDENIFSVVQELPYTYKYNDKIIFSFRPDITFFLNGIYIGYSELKSNYNDQNARKNGRKKVGKDYREAVEKYLKLAVNNDITLKIRKEFLKVFEKAIHITTTDINETYIIRSISQHFDDVKKHITENDFAFENYEKNFYNAFKTYPVRNSDTSRTKQFEEIYRVLYDKKMIEKEILYYNFIERELVKKEGKKQKEYKHNDGRLISPRPKQKFGTDKIMSKIDEFLEHENDDDYFINKLKEELKGLSEKQRKELIEKRNKYNNNKTVYSLLLQYAAGFGKSNIIGWSALQLKDLRKNKKYIYDKILLVVDRVQLRDQLDTKMYNMNINNSMFIEASDKKSFIKALKTDVRIVVVNLQKFMSVKEIFSADITKKLSGLRIAFLIDEIHRSNTGSQHDEMISLFDELQTAFDKNEEYKKHRSKKNLIIGFTATPSDNSLARFGEFGRYADNQAIWVPFDSYTMREAIEDGYILNPLSGLVPVSSKMYFEMPENLIEGFEGDTMNKEIPSGTSTGIDEFDKKYAIRKKKIYNNDDRIKAVSKFVVQQLVTSVYIQIRGTAKAMLAVSSVKAALKYKKHISQYFESIVQDKKYEKYKDAPVHIVYSSDGQNHPNPSSLNNGLSESKVLQSFAINKNGIIIVVEKLQTGFDEPKLHTLFLDKEIRGINAIQTISRVNRKIKNKNNCKIIDLSYKNVNINNIKNAFEKFSNVVVSDFDPFSDEKVLKSHYSDLIEHDLYTKNIFGFKTYYEGNRDISLLTDIEDAFVEFIEKNSKEAEKLKKKVSNYFRILDLIEYVIKIDKKYSEVLFLEFWKKYNIEYRQIKKTNDVDDVEVYFDNKIGIVAPPEEKQKKEKKQKGDGNSKQYKFNILAVIEKRNEEEAAIEEMIKEFENKIQSFFDYIKTDDSGLRIMAKMDDDGSAFSQEEIYEDFEKIYRKFIRRNRKELGAFFIKVTKDLINQLCDDFEKTLTKEYNINTPYSKAADGKQEYKK